jgi:hypothetical protein
MDRIAGHRQLDGMMNRRHVLADVDVTGREGGAGEKSGAKQETHENEQATPRQILSPEV